LTPVKTDTANGVSTAKARKMLGMFEKVCREKCICSGFMSLKTIIIMVK